MTPDPLSRQISPGDTSDTTYPRRLACVVRVSFTSIRITLHFGRPFPLRNLFRDEEHAVLPIYCECQMRANVLGVHKALQ